MLPPAVQKEVRERPDLTTLQNCIDHVLSDLGRINDAHLSKMHMERLKQSLSTSQRISPVMNMEETGDSAEASDNTSKPEDKHHLVVNALSEKMESMVAAIARPKPRAQPKKELATLRILVIDASIADPTSIEPKIALSRNHCSRRMVANFLRDTKAPLTNGKRSSRRHRMSVLSSMMTTRANSRRLTLPCLSGVFRNVQLPQDALACVAGPTSSTRIPLPPSLMTMTMTRIRLSRPSNTSRRM